MIILDSFLLFLTAMLLLSKNASSYQSILSSLEEREALKEDQQSSIHLLTIPLLGMFTMQLF